MFGMHAMRDRIFGCHRQKGPQAHMKRYSLPRHTMSRQPFQQCRREMKAGRRRGDRPVMLRENSLIILDITDIGSAFAGNIGRQRYFALRGDSSVESGAAKRKVDLRRASRLLVIGDLRVPRVTVRVAQAGPRTSVVVELSPAAPARVVSPVARRLEVEVDVDALDLTLPAFAPQEVLQSIAAGDRPTTIRLVTASRKWCSSSASRSAALPLCRPAKEISHQRTGAAGGAPCRSTR